MPDMPLIFGCKANDWLRGICSSCKRLHTWSQCCSVGRCVEILAPVGIFG